jgi:hypothetical protein
MKQRLAGSGQDLILAQLLLALLLFASPLLTWWSAAGSNWYLPYLLWAVIILIAFLIQRLHHHDV